MALFCHRDCQSRLDRFPNTCMHISTYSVFKRLFSSSFACKRLWMFVWLLALCCGPNALAQQSSVTDNSNEQNTRDDSEGVAVEQALLNRIDDIDIKRVVVHANEQHMRLARQLDSLMSSLGISNVEVRTIDSVPDEVQVRYFYVVDFPAADVLVDVLMMVFDEVSLRDFQNYEPAPAQGLIEVWLP